MDICSKISKFYLFLFYWIFELQIFVLSLSIHVCIMSIHVYIIFQIICTYEF